MQNKVRKTYCPVRVFSKPVLPHSASTIIQEWKARSYKGLQHMTRTVEGAKQIVTHVT